MNGEYLTVADRLRAARGRMFVGRAAELRAFTALLAPGEAPFTLLWLHGPGGIGKSALVERLADEARSAGARPLVIDGSAVDPTPHALRHALAEHLDRGPDRGRLVLLVDAAEALAGLEGWLRTDFLPGLPGSSIVVIAGRRPPGPAWRTDLGWSQHLRVLRIPDLGPEDVREYLDRRGLPEGDLAEVLARTHGHPLALALMCDAWDRREMPAGPRPGEFQDAVATLVARFLDDVPDPSRRRALQVLGHARATTVDLLRATIGPDDAEACFDWLCGLSFVRAGPDGLVPHDLARDVLDQDLRWRDRTAWRELHGRIRTALTATMAAASGREQARAAADLLWFHRGSPALAVYPSWDELSTLWVEPGQAEDLPAVLDLVRRHEGEESARRHTVWWEAQPEAFLVVRSAERRVHGFCVQLALAGEPAVPDDPVAAAAWQLVATLAPLRPGEHARVIRSWAGHDGYQRPTATQQAMTAFLARRWLTEPGLAVSVGYGVDERLWTPLFAYVDYARAPLGDAVAGDRRFHAYLHDWRITPPAAWLELLEAREDSGRDPTQRLEEMVRHAQRHLEGRAEVVLQREDFDRAVRAALRAATRPAELADNPLLRSRLLAATAGPDGVPRAEDLRALLHGEVAALRQDPRREVVARVLELTYLSPTRTQEAAAARLGLPFSTFRRHLTAGVALVSQALWDREVAGG